MKDIDKYINKHQYKKAYNICYKAILKRDAKAYKHMGDLYLAGYFVEKNLNPFIFLNLNIYPIFNF